MIIIASCQFPDPIKSPTRPSRAASSCVNLYPPIHTSSIIPPLPDYLIPTLSSRKQPISSILPPQSRPRSPPLPPQSRSSVFTLSRKRAHSPKRRSSLPPLKRTLLLLQESVRRHSEEYEDGEEMEKKRRAAASTPFRRLGSALQASFKKIKPKGKDEGDYETLPEREHWEKRSFRGLLRASKRYFRSPKPDSPVSIRRLSQIKIHPRATCRNQVPQEYDSPPLQGLQRNISIEILQNANRTVSDSSWIITPISVYTDYEVPDEVLDYEQLADDYGKLPQPDDGEETDYEDLEEECSLTHVTSSIRT